MKTNRKQILQIYGKDQIFKNDSTKSLFKVSPYGTLHNCFNPEHGGRHAAPKLRQPTTNQRCVTTQKSVDLIYTAAEAWNRAHQ